MRSREDAVVEEIEQSQKEQGVEFLELPRRTASRAPHKQIAKRRDSDGERGSKKMSAMQQHYGDVEKEKNEWRAGKEIVDVGDRGSEPCRKDRESNADS